MIDCWAATILFGMTGRGQGLGGGVVDFVQQQLGLRSFGLSKVQTIPLIITETLTHNWQRH